MQRLTSIACRTLFFFAFLIILPILALPKVASLVDKLLYNDAPTVVQAPVIEMTGQQVVEPQFGERVSPAKFEEALVQDPTDIPRRAEGLDTLASAPPQLSPLPAFASQPQQPAVESPMAGAQLDPATVARLQQVRERLEMLGARYMILETATGATGYRFHCEMQVDPRSPSTQNFDAASPSPLEAAETVLRQVEGWRTAAAQTGTVVQ